MENQKGSNLLGGIAMTKIIDLSVKEKIYKSKKAQISILNGFRLEVAAGEKIAIVGESGAGKSSLLNIIGLLDRNYVGEYTLFGSPTDQLHTSQLAQWRNQRIGFVLQESALINSLTVEYYSIMTIGYFQIMRYSNDSGVKLFVHVKKQGYRIGFVLQESALINSLTVEDNIKLPFLYASSDKKGVRKVEDFDTGPQWQFFHRRQLQV